MKRESYTEKKNSGKKDIKDIRKVCLSLNNLDEEEAVITIRKRKPKNRDNEQEFIKDSKPKSKNSFS